MSDTERRGGERHPRDAARLTHQEYDENRWKEQRQPFERAAVQSRPVRRRLLNLVTAASLLLCVAVAALWVRSYWVFDDVGLAPRRGITYRAAVRPGLIVVSRAVLSGRTTDVFSDDFDRGPGWSVRSRPRGGPESPFTAEGSPRVVQWAGFDYLARDESRPRFGTLALRRIVAPMWLPLVVAAALPSWRGWSWLKRPGSQRRAGLCPTCGYDLRGNVSGVCPECGAGR